MRIKGKKGFTLIELLAVIAIIGILSVIVVPNVIKMYKGAKLQVFMTQVKNIYKVAGDQFSKDVIEGGIISRRYYYAGEAGSENPLKLSGSKKVYYDIQVEDGKIKKIIVSNEESSIYLEHLTEVDLSSIMANAVKSKGEDGYIALEDGSIEEKKIYGISWSGTGSTLTRTDDAVGMTYTVNESTITSDFDNAQIYRDMIEVTDEFGNIFIKIPKFYIKKTTDGTNWTWQISKKKHNADYYLPACFYDEESSTELSYILIGKYSANLSSDGTKLESKSGKASLVSKTIAEFRNYAKANGEKYQLIDIHILDLLQVLFYVEYATLNSTDIMNGFISGAYSSSDIISAVNGTTLTLPSGSGANYNVGQMISIGTTLGGNQIAKNLRITAKTANTITYETISGISTIATISPGQIIYSTAYLSGATDGVSTSSGSPLSNSSGLNPMKYRNIENLYANIFQFIDGINISARVAYVAKNAKQYATNVFDGAYEQVGYANAGTSKWIVKMGYDSAKPFVNLPTTVGTENNSTFKDYYSQAAGNRVFLFGGSWLYGNSSGLNRFDLNCAYDYTSSDVGSRLIKTP